MKAIPVLAGPRWQRPSASIDLTLIRPSQITPESVYCGRRAFIAATAGGVLALGGCGGDDEVAVAPAEVIPGDPIVGLQPATISTTEPRTSYRDATHYNNYYEFGTGKADPAKSSIYFRPRPWQVEIAGEVAKPGTFDLDDLLRGLPVEERIYRMRCVEGWSMVLPWAGVELGKLIRRLEPTSRAKYVAFTTLMARERMPGQRYPVLDWPYREGLRMDEAMHPLTLLAVGLYGHVLPNQNGAPVRLVVPWKYGFKGIKGIVRIELTEHLPVTSWQQAAADEYGFYANVNPEVDHPRWSQKTERRIAGSGGNLFAERIPTLPFNGYADQVAGMYAGLDLRVNY